MSEFDFRPYLTWVVDFYGKQQERYIPTDGLLRLEARLEKRNDRGEQADDRPRQVEEFAVLDGLRKYGLGEQREHVLLAGRPGSGKSTALRQLLLELAAPLAPQFWGESNQMRDQSPPELGDLGGQIPVLVQLKSDRSVPELIKAEFRRAKVKVTIEQIDDWLLDDRLILLLDGVNEIPNNDRRQELEQFREDNLSVPMIFTTRDLAVGGDLGIGKRLEMKPLSPEQMRDFVGPEHGEQLLGQLADRLPEIAETPLLLWMLCQLFDPESGTIPLNKGELFREFDRRYEEFKGLMPVSADFRRFKSEILQHLAFVMMTGDGGVEFELTIEWGKAEGAIEELLTGRVSEPGKLAKEWLEDLVEHHLLQVASDPRRVEFHHQLFQEYYAAEALLVMLRDKHPDVMQEERFKYFYLNYLKWTESIAIALILGLPEIKQETAVEIIEQALNVDLMLGAQLAGSLRFNQQCQMTNLILEKSAGITNCECIWLKIKLAFIIRSKAIVEQLIPLLNHVDRNVRSLAYYTIYSISPELLKEDNQATRDAREISQLTSNILQNDFEFSLLEPGILECCTPKARLVFDDWQAANSTNEMAVEQLKEILSSQDENNQWSTIKILEVIDCEDKIPVLMEILQSKESSARHAAVVLGCSKYESAIPGLKDIIASDAEPQVKWNAVISLRLIGSAGAVLGIVDATYDGNELVVDEAFRAIEFLVDDLDDDDLKRTIPSLVFHLLSDHVGNRRISALILWKISSSARACVIYLIKNIQRNY